MAPQLTVRPAGPDDAETLAQLRWDWRSVERGEQGMDRGEFQEALVHWIGQHHESHLAWLAEVDGVPEGMAWLALVDRIPSVGAWPRVSGNLQSVYIRAAQRGQGLGALLLRAVIDEARQRRLEFVNLHPSPLSIPLYRRMGFIDAGDTLELWLQERRHRPTPPA
jgi:GNAT superfamily N-acetyltransferase